jgi:predicted ATP-binding protein involved in virulence
MQIVLATHSADLLDHVNPEEVRLLSRSSSDGSVTVDSVASGEPGWREAFRNYDDSLGSMWKSGGLRGVPGGG